MLISSSQQNSLHHSRLYEGGNDERGNGSDEKDEICDF